MLTRLNTISYLWKCLIAGTIALGSVTYGIAKYYAGGVCHCKKRLDNQVIIITGANSGIGKALAEELVRRGAVIVLACRNRSVGEAAKEEIINKTRLYDARIFVRILDLNSFDSIIRFAKLVTEQFTSIYALVNNAGVFYYPQVLTADGFDVTYQTNYLGPFVLTHHLLKALKLSPESKIVNVGSEGHRLANRKDLHKITDNQSDYRSHFVAYGVSKLALHLFTRELAKKLQSYNIAVNTANPGNVETNIFRNFPQLANPYLAFLQWPIRRLVVKNPRQGAQTVLHLLLTSDISTGQYYSNCKQEEPTVDAQDDVLAHEYYQTTLEKLDQKFITESEC